MSYLSLIISLICFFTACALFFSVNAIALRTISHGKLLEAFKKTNSSQSPEDLAESLIRNGEKLMLTCSFYRLIANCAVLLLLLALFLSVRPAGLNLIDYLLVFVIATAIFSVFSLAIPHAWAKYVGEKILSRTYMMLMFLAAVAWPFLYVRKITDAFVRRLAGVAETTPQEKQEEKQEEFLTGLEQHRTEGALDEEEQKMIEKVLELSDTTADEIMTPRTDVIAVDVNSDRKTVLDIIINAGHSRVPVYQDNIDNIVGLIYAKDLLTEMGKTDQQFQLRDKLREAYFVPETKPLRALLHEFQNQKSHIAIVLDEYGGTAGIVTIEDIIEELVGEITDEYEQLPPEPIRKIDQNNFEVDARTYIDDLNDQLELSLPEDEDYDTIGGFVFSYLGYIPKTGETFNYKNLKFAITSAEARRIKRIKIQLVSPEQ